MTPEQQANEIAQRYVLKYLGLKPEHCALPQLQPLVDSMTSDILQETGLVERLKEHDQLRAELAATKQGMKNEEDRVEGFIADTKKLYAELAAAQKCVEALRSMIILPAPTACDCMLCKPHRTAAEALAAYDKVKSAK